jgi:hypothetical protein
MLTVRHRDSGDPNLPLLEVHNGPLRAAFLPSVGGRLLSLRIDDHELLWVNPHIFDRSLRALKPRATWPTVDGTMSTWANVGGSKTWPAPQGWDGDHQWPGPPDAVLDSGKWSVSTSTSAETLSVTMESPYDTRTGLCVTRKFTFTEGATNFHQKIRFLNISTQPVEWSLWEVVQTDTSTGGVVEVAVSTDARPIDLGHYAGSAAVTVLNGKAQLRIAPGVAKFGFPNATGRVAWSGPQGETLGLAVAVEDGARYPDDGSRVELWTQSPLAEPLGELGGLHPDAWLVELEVLSPLRTLGPGESTDFGIVWEARGRERPDAAVAAAPQSQKQPRPDS